MLDEARVKRALQGLRGVLTMLQDSTSTSAEASALYHVSCAMGRLEAQQKSGRSREGHKLGGHYGLHH